MNRNVRVLVDLSSVLWNCLLVGKDREFGYDVEHEGKMVLINTAEYGWENVVNSTLKMLDTLSLTPHQMIIVPEGVNSKSLRTAIYPEYKGSRDSRPEAQTDEFHKLKARYCETFLNLGAQVAWQDYVEADDVIAYLAKHLGGHRFIWTTDGDMLALAGDDVGVLIDGHLNPDKFGGIPFDCITVYKALVGDSSDNLKGAKGLGPKAFQQIHAAFGDKGLRTIGRIIELGRIPDLAEDVAECPPLQKVIDFHESVTTSWKCAKMYPERINTFRKPLNWQVGLCRDKSHFSDERLHKWAATSRIVDATNYRKAIPWLAQKFRETPFVALDIETSTPAESTDWLANQTSERAKKMVDVFGSELSGLGLTFGDNLQHSVYFTVDHETEHNLATEEVLEVVRMIPDDKRKVIHNLNFELSVLFNEWGAREADNGEHGFLTHVDDTLLMASYVDENIPLGLKERSSRTLGYTQIKYEEVTQGRKMRDLTPDEVVDYGLDDTRCTAALYNHYKLVMEIERTWDVYRDVEIDAAYLTALGFLHGTKVDMVEMARQEREDDQAYDAAWRTLKSYLIEQGWYGANYVPCDGTPAAIKYVYEVVTGEKLETGVRMVTKLADAIRDAGQPVLAELVRSQDWASVDAYALTLFNAEPDFNVDSPKQLVHLLYEVVKLPVRLRNKATDAQRAAGQRQGNPKANALALTYSLHMDCENDEARKEVIKALVTMKLVKTRRKLFYGPYRGFSHWKDGLVHAQPKQCATNTRRYAYTNPNLQQLPKAKGPFRKCFVPHKKGAVIVSLDFAAQELRVIADYSRDENMLACFIGDNKKDMHSLTALRIAQRDRPEMSYETFVDVLATDDHEDYKWAKGLRAKGKTTNFASEYGAKAPKMAQTLMVSEEEAQAYLDAKWTTFAQAEAWKSKVITEFHNTGLSTTKLGARRHLQEPARTSNTFERGKGERQSVNFRIQGSSAEMTKKAMGRMWRSGVMFRFDARFFGVVHDEVVFSVDATEAYDFICEIHALMTAPYADMFVPIVSSISLGKTFGDQIECGETPDRVKIEEAIAKALGSDAAQALEVDAALTMATELLEYEPDDEEDAVVY